MCYEVMGKKPILSGKGGAPPLSEGSLAWKMVLTEPLALIILNLNTCGVTWVRLQ